MLQDQRSPRCCVRYLEELRGGPAKSSRAAASQGACGRSRRELEAMRALALKSPWPRSTSK
jgi:hypothetical protein